MDVSGIGSIYGSTAIGATQVTPTGDASASAPVVGAEQSTPSERGKMMSALADLQKTDPQKFKQVTADIAQKLRETAATAGGDQGAFLGKLADAFDEASKSGELSALQPAGGASGHHGGHHHVKKYAAANPAGGDSRQRVDPMQIIDSVLEQDGIPTP